MTVAVTVGIANRHAVKRIQRTPRPAGLRQMGLQYGILRPDEGIMFCDKPVVFRQKIVGCIPAAQSSYHQHRIEMLDLCRILRCT